MVLNVIKKKQPNLVLLKGKGFFHSSLGSRPVGPTPDTDESV